MQARVEVRPETPVDAGRVLVGRLSWFPGEGDLVESSSLETAADGPPGRGGRGAHRLVDLSLPAPRGFLAGPLGPAVRWLGGIFGVAALTVLAVSAAFDPGEIEQGRHLEAVGVVAEACPGCSLCGLSRAFSAMTHLDVTQAIGSNAAVVWTYPLAALTALAGPLLALKGF